MSGAKIDDDAAGPTRPWVVTWEDVERAQLETVLMATPAQRLAWLEDAMHLAWAAGALEVRRDQSEVPGRSDSADRPSEMPARGRSPDHRE